MPGDLTRPGNLTAPAIPNAWTAPRVTEPTLNCSNSVTELQAIATKRACAAGAGRGMAGPSLTGDGWPGRPPNRHPADRARLEFSIVPHELVSIMPHF